VETLISHSVIINLIASTATKAGLKIRAEFDRGSYLTKVAVAAEEFCIRQTETRQLSWRLDYAIRSNLTVGKNSHVFQARLLPKYSDRGCALDRLHFSESPVPALFPSQA
jgi:hypothetical protein